MAVENLNGFARKGAKAQQEKHYLRPCAFACLL